MKLIIKILMLPLFIAAVLGGYIIVLVVLIYEKISHSIKSKKESR